MKQNYTELKQNCCTNCDAVILNPMLKRYEERMLENYREHEIELSNGSLVRVAVCADCKEILTSGTSDSQDAARNIVERHKVWWENNLPEDDPRMPKFHKEIFVVDADSSVEKFVGKVAEQNAEKERVRQWQSEKAEFEIAERKRNKILDSNGEEMKVEMPSELKDFEEWKASQELKKAGAVKAKK